MPPAPRLLKSGDRLPSFSFGVAGVDRWDELESSRGKLGIVRDVRQDHEGGHVGGVSYEFETLGAGIGCPWRRGSTLGRWELDLHTTRDPQSLTGYTSLEGLSRQIREQCARQGRLPDNDENLLTLDRVLRGVFEKVRYLHASKRVVGLLTPENVISFFNEKRELIVLLPDVGFGWRGAPPVPPWMSRLEERWSELWHPKAADVFQRRDWTKEAERGDVVLLARFCLWVLTGSIKNADQSAREHFLAGTRDTSGAASARCWQILYQVLATDEELTSIGLKRIVTVTEFAEKLQQTPLSEHFKQKRRRAKPTISWYGMSVAFVVVVLMAIAGYLALNPQMLEAVGGLFGSTGRPPNRLCPDCKHPSALLPILDELEPVLRDLDAGVSVMKSAPGQSHDSGLRTGIAGIEQTRGLLDRLRAAQLNSPGDRTAESACIEKLDAELGRRIDQLGMAFVESAQTGNVVEQTAIAGRLVELFDSWQKSSAPNTKEKPSWYEIVRLTLLGE